MMFWSPDTCGCTVEEAVPPGGGPKTFVGVVWKCPAHAAVADADLYDVLYAAPHGENKRKNQLEGFVLGQPDFGQDVFGPRGETMRMFKPGVGVAWDWVGDGADRVLVVSVRGVALTAQQRKAITDFVAGGPHAGRIALL